ncbi:TPA: hypothetical protein QHR38_004812, partial [Escherichia coli]|nr:hypothetical protein [Escherichia coli]
EYSYKPHGSNKPYAGNGALEKIPNIAFKSKDDGNISLKNGAGLSYEIIISGL